MINFKELAKQLLDKYERLTPYEQYKWFLSQYYLSIHKLGKENFRQTDCSGILSGALWLAGFNIRCTAQFFFDHIFLSDCNPPIDGEKYVVAFILNSVTGDVGHLIPHIENEIYIEATEKCRLVTRGFIDAVYNKNSNFVDYRTTSEKTLQAFSVSLLAATEIDAELKRLVEV